MKALEYSEKDDDNKRKYLYMINIAHCYLILENIEKSLSYLNEVKAELCNDKTKFEYYRVLGKYFFQIVFIYYY